MKIIFGYNTNKLKVNFLKKVQQEILHFLRKVNIHYILYFPSSYWTLEDSDRNEKRRVFLTRHWRRNWSGLECPTLESPFSPLSPHSRFLSEPCWSTPQAVWEIVKQHRLYRKGKRSEKCPEGTKHRLWIPCSELTDPGHLVPAKKGPLIISVSNSRSQVYGFPNQGFMRNNIKSNCNNYQACLLIEFEISVTSI